MNDIGEWIPSFIRSIILLVEVDGRSVYSPEKTILTSRLVGVYFSHLLTLIS